jgi:hypothetical protein
LAIKRQVIAELRDQHMGEKSGPGLAARDWQRRHRLLSHGLAFTAGIGGPHMPDHLEAAGDVIQNLGDILAHFAQSAAAHRAGATRFVHDLPARQRLGQLAALLLRRSLFWRRVLRHGRSHLGGSLCFGLRRLKLFEFELELLQFAARALGGGAEAHALQPRDLDLQLFNFERSDEEARLGRGEFGTGSFDSGGLSQHQLFERGDIVGQSGGERHARLSICFAGLAPSPSGLGKPRFLWSPPLKPFKQHRHLRR